MNSEYKRIMDRVKNIDSIVDTMEDTTNALSQDVMTFEHETNALEREVKEPPLLKLTEMLDRWSSETIHTNDEIQKFAHELWVSLAEYEKDIKESVQGHQIIIAMKDYKFMNHIEWIKNKFGFQLELYDVRALICRAVIASLHGPKAEAKAGGGPIEDGPERTRVAADELQVRRDSTRQANIRGCSRLQRAARGPRLHRHSQEADDDHARRVT